MQREIGDLRSQTAELILHVHSAIKEFPATRILYKPLGKGKLVTRGPIKCKDTFFQVYGFKTPSLHSCMSKLSVRSKTSIELAPLLGPSN